MTDAAVGIASSSPIRGKETRHMRTMLFAAASLSLLIGAPSMAAPCKDAKGRFAKCPKAPTKAVECKSANGKFAKCGTAGAKPV